MCSVAALLAMSLMMVLGLKPLLRTMAYETFLYSHIILGMWVAISVNLLAASKH